MLRETFYKEIGRYAKELKDYPDVYNPNDPQNKDKLIKKNLRIGVSIAIKAAVKYHLDDDETDDVISQGLLGVAVAYEKYNPNKSDLRTQVLNGLRDKMTGRTFQKLLDRCNAYGTAKVFDRPLSATYTRDELAQWLEEHIPIAKFSSVAWMWSNAYVKEEIRNILNRRSTAGELEDDVPEPRQRDQEKWELLFDNIGETDLYLFELRNGLGGERAMTFRDISKRTGFQIGVIRRACETVFNLMKENAKRHNLKIGDILP